MPQEADEQAWVPWREQFPFAHEYARESVFGNPGRDPHFPRGWDQLENRKDIERSSLAFNGFSVVSTLASSDTPIKIYTKEFKLDYEEPIFYWEVEIDATSGPLVKNMGFQVLDKMLSLTRPGPYYIDAVQANMDQSRETSPTGAMEVIGCGISYTGCAFSTKNGHLIDSHLPALGNIAPWQCVWGCLRLHRCSNRHAIIQANFGQKPFAFDITGYCKSSLRHLRYLCNTLPRELLDVILSFILLDIQHNEEEDRSGFNIHRDISRISLVCRRWRTVAQRQVIRQLELQASTDVRRASALPLLWNCPRLRTDEKDAPWIHTFLASTLPHRLTSTTNWDCVARQSCVFGQGLPGSISHTIPALLRRGCFTNITNLTFSGLRFQSWLQFARFVLSFQHLDQLSLSGVTWNEDEASPLPPHWIRVARRIRRIWVKDHKPAPEGTIQRSNFQSGLLCLFFTGRRVTSPPTSNNSLVPVLSREELGTVASIAHHVCRMTGTIDHLRYEQISPAYCTVSGFRSENSRVRRCVLVLTFMHHPQESTSQLAHISVHIDSHCEQSLQDRLFKPLTQLLSTLSNCDCNFNFSNLGDEYRLLSQVYMHEAVDNGLRVDAATYDDHELWRWEDDDEHRSPVRVRCVAVKQYGDIITIVWHIPRSLYDCRSKLRLSVDFYTRHGIEMSSVILPKLKSPIRYITAIRVGIADLVLPPQTGEQIYFQVIITYNGHCHHSSRHAYASSD